MPSRSPEPPSGATRDEAIAAAREEYGSDVRIRGVRRVRSGGVAGFFSSERYVADVVVPAAVPAAVAAPAPSLSTEDALAQWPAAGLSVDDLLAVAQEVARAQQAAAPAAVDPVAELADLFGSGPAEVAVYSPASVARPAPAAPVWERTRRALPETPPAAVEAPVDTEPAVSPFAAALMRMTDHDAEVQTAVATSAALDLEERAARQAAVLEAERAAARQIQAAQAEEDRRAALAEAPPAPSRVSAALAAAAGLRAAAIQAAGELAALPPPPPTSTSLLPGLGTTPVVPPAPPPAPPLHPTTPTTREEDQQVSMDQPFVESSAPTGADEAHPVRRPLPPAAVPAPAALDLWGAPVPPPAPEVDDHGRHRPVGAPASFEATRVEVPERPAPTEDDLARLQQLEALRAAAMAGVSLTPRRRRSDRAGRHRPADAGPPAPSTPTQDDATGRTATGFADSLAALADSEYVTSGIPVVEADLAPEVSSDLVEEMAAEMAAGMAEVLARTASDPAPLRDGTTVLPSLASVLGAAFTAAPAPRVRGTKPPVPPARGGRTRAVPPHPTTRGRDEGWATVTHLVPPAATPSAPSPAATETVDPDGLTGLGLTPRLLGPDFAARARTQGTFAALVASLTETLPAAPTAPTGAGDVLVVAGPGAEALASARTLATSLRLDPAAVQWATRGELAGLTAQDLRVPTAAVAAERRAQSRGAGVPTVVALDVPLRDAGSPWVAQVLEALAPTAVWGVLDATRKPADLAGWVRALPRVDAVVVTETESSADPAALLDGLTVPVAVVDGARATPHRWAALLCERSAGRS
ncbi:hypothetical protein F1C76_14540 [Geodermatophilaceae bacterium NBWT11]|nr:hypothetical protein F1C76_14540 [Geodermatophilaceae bacterium NBWT11]